MASDDTDEQPGDDGSDDRFRDDLEGALGDGDADVDGSGDGNGGRTRAVEEVDQRIVDLLSWILDTETRAKIYVHLLANPGSTSEEVAKGTGLYPSTVREALAELHDEGRVTREKRASEGAGNNPYEYTAIQPSDLVGGVVDQVQQELNTIFALDRILDRQSEAEAEPELEDGAEPVTITVDDTTPPESDADDDRHTEAHSRDHESDESAEDGDETADVGLVDEGGAADADRDES